MTEWERSIFKSEEERERFSVPVFTFYQVGDFYEIYSMLDKRTGQFVYGFGKEFSDVMDCKLTASSSRSKNGSDWEVYMAGVPVGGFKNNWDYRILNAGYKVVL